jgi:nitrate/nitrite transporter NarK
MAGALTRLASGVGVGGTAVALSLQPALLVPVVAAVAALGGLPMLLITTLALVAVYSRRPDRRVAAENILDRLLTALRPPQSSKISGSKGRKTTK